MGKVHWIEVDACGIPRRRFYFSTHDEAVAFCHLVRTKGYAVRQFGACDLYTAESALAALPILK